MHGTVMCVVDDPRVGPEALELAVELSDRLGLRLVLLLITEPGSDAVTPDEGEIGQLLTRLAKRGSTEAVEFRVAAPKSAVHLGWIVAEEAADVIVVGATRSGWPRGGLKSPLADELACETKVPIVIAPPPTRRAGSRGRRQTTASR